MKNTLSNQESARNLLLQVIRPLAAEKKKILENKKRGREGLKRADFIWHYLLQSFATMGKASGSKGLIDDQANYERVKYEALVSLPPKRREKQILEACKAAKVRMPNRKTKFIIECFQLVQKLGGPIAVKEILLTQSGREAKMKFLMTFSGIGPKYARNMMMDVYHKEFRDSIAIDARIKSISKVIGLSFSESEYEKHEAFYLNVASQAGLNGWELDRLLFNFSEETKSRLAIAAKALRLRSRF